MALGGAPGIDKQMRASQAARRAGRVHKALLSGNGWPLDRLALAAWHWERIGWGGWGGRTSNFEPQVGESPPASQREQFRMDYV